MLTLAGVGWLSAWSQRPAINSQIIFITGDDYERMSAERRERARALVH